MGLLVVLGQIWKARTRVIFRSLREKWGVGGAAAAKNSRAADNSEVIVGKMGVLVGPR